MVPADSCDQTSIPRPACHRSLARELHLDALTLVGRLHRLDLCGWAVRLALRQCPPLHVADLLMLLAAVVRAAVALRHGSCAARREQ